MSDIYSCLRWRGFRVVAANLLENVVLPPREEDQEEYYQLLKDYYFRRILADLVQVKEVGPKEREALAERWSEEALKKYWPVYERLGLLIKEGGKSLFFKRHLDNFGGTFEWFLGRVLEKEFLAQVLWSVRLEGVSGGGDFDVLALFGEKLFYLEGKSSPPNNVPYAEIEKFLQREEELSCHCAIMISDTTLKIERNILDNLIYAIRKRLGMDKEKAHALIKDLNGNIYFISPKIFILNTKRDIVVNLDKVLNFFFSLSVPRFQP